GRSRRDAPAAGLRRRHRRRPHDTRAHHPRADRDRRRSAGPHPRPRMAGVDRGAGVRGPTSVRGAHRDVPRHRRVPTPLARAAVVGLWIGLNVAVWRFQWDPYPFILLNLVFSTQAAYAAPLILLAQNRQEERDRAQTERDREQSARTQADTEFLAREIASIRLA